MSVHWNSRSLLLLLWATSIVCLALSTSAFAHTGFHEEIEELTSRIDAYPENAGLYVRRGNLYREHAEWALARADFDHARQIDPDLPMIDLYQGKLLMDLGELTQARQALNTFLAREPHSVEGFVTRARIWEASGRNLQAATDYNSAIREFRAPKRPLPEHYFNRSKALAAAGNQYLAVALEGLEEGMNVLGPIITLELYALELEMQGKRYDDALARVDRIADRANRKESWLIRRGEILEQMGRGAEALEAYEAADAAIETLPLRLRETKGIMKLKKKAEKSKRDLGGRNQP